MFGNLKHGPYVDDESSPLIRANVLYDNGRAGIAVLGNGPVEIRDNEACGNHWEIAITVLAINTELAANDIHNNDIDLATDVAVNTANGG